MENIIFGRQFEAIDGRQFMKKHKADFGVNIHLINEKYVISLLADRLDGTRTRPTEAELLAFDEYSAKVDGWIVFFMQWRQQAVRLDPSQELFTSLTVVHNSPG